MHARQLYPPCLRCAALKTGQFVSIAYYRAKNGLLKPNTVEYVAHVFVVNGSAFGLDGKLHRAWPHGK